MSRIVAAPDKFRGTASASAVASAMANAARHSGWDAREIPMADGGEGILEALGGRPRHSMVHGPLGGVVRAEWRLSDDTAVIEMARASGLSLAGGPSANDALEASTRGTGELILAAVAAGARNVVVGVGGSATTDGGLGAVEAIGSRGRLKGASVTVACDVDTAFVDAAAVFAPQKGATPSQVSMLTRRLERLVQVYRSEFGVDVSELRGGGAAGGLAGGLAALGAELLPGFELVSETVGLPDAIGAADLVLTGEGLLDEQSFHGKVVGGVVDVANDAGRGVLVVVGDVDEGALDAELGVEIISLSSVFGRERSLSNPLKCVEDVVSDYLARPQAERRR